MAHTAAPAASRDPGRNCIPKHPAAPVRLCPTHSGSGWWVYASATGQIVEDGGGRLAYVPYWRLVQGLSERSIFVSEALAIIWTGNDILISTRYPDGKAYVFSVLAGGRIVHHQW